MSAAEQQPGTKAQAETQAPPYSAPDAEATAGPDNSPGAEQQALARSPFFGRWAVGGLIALALLLALAALAAWRTQDAMAGLSFLHIKGSTQRAPASTLVDETPWQTATQLAALATTQEELAYARQAERLADHDVNQAFAAALRAAALKQHALTGEALALQGKVDALTTQTAADQATVQNFGTARGDDYDEAQAQLALDQDELNDARADLARASGDQRGEIQQELVAREAEVKKFDAAAGAGQDAVAVARQYRTLFRFVSAWQAQRERLRLIAEAQTAAQRLAAALAAQHDGLEKQSAAPSTTANQAVAEATVERVARLKRLSLRRQLMSIDDDRTQTEAQLAAVYGKWAAQVELQHRIVAHLIAVQLIYLLIIAFAALLATALVRFFAERERLDGRRMRTLSRIARLGVQVLALAAMLLVVFGPPERVSTVIGLATAGLTVALQDFILAFVGWFLLMGRSGIGVGDIVEINAVTGEVIDIGLFRTTLLETGNWTAKGHPTGRRVAFNNKYAISGQFFNFSTTGQWMWDELTVTVPAGQETGPMLERIQKVVADEAGEDAALAEAEWKRVYARRGLSQFSAEPDVNLRPSATGFDLIVRYVTRAGGRFDRRKTLYACVVEAVRSPEPAAAPPTATPAAAAPAPV